MSVGFVHTALAIVGHRGGSENDGASKMFEYLTMVHQWKLPLGRL